MEAETELNSILEDALQMRTAQERPLKRYFDSLPGCIQRTLFEEDVPEGERTREKALEFMAKGDTLVRRNQLVEALLEFEKAAGRVYFVKLREKAPHWRERGVRDEYIRVRKVDETLAGEALTRVAKTLFQIKQYREAFELCGFILKETDGQSNFDALVISAQTMLKTNLTRDAEDNALELLVMAAGLKPEDEQCKALILELKQSQKARNRAENKMFKGVFNKPGVRLVDEKEEDESDNQRAEHRELDELEKEAARMAGLDVSDPAIKALLLKLSTKEGRAMFEKEQRRIEKVEKRESAYWWLCLVSFGMIVFILLLQLWLKSLTQNIPITDVWRMHLGSSSSSQQSLLAAAESASPHAQEVDPFEDEL